MGYTPHVLVIGGGVTGTGVARDLAMRGLDVTLVEKGTLTDGTTGRMHGLLHSGARYAVSDPETARACMAENRVLRDIAGHCIQETGGLFVELPGDPEGYFEDKRAACEAADIPVETLSGEEAREREPTLSPAVQRALAVPDAAVDPFRLTVANAKSAMAHGADIRTHTKVISLEVVEDIVALATIRESDPDEPGTSLMTTLDPDYVVNAAGPWADDVARMANLDLDLQHSKGAMVVVHDAGVDTVLNRCRPTSDADIVVPHDHMAILGTTAEPVPGPEEVSEERGEVDRLLEDLSAVLPGLEEARTIRSYWGVRPLYDPDGASGDGPRSASRGFSLIDHQERDGVWGMTTVVGGKFTTARRMAEAVADEVCAEFGIDRPCRTAEEPLPGSETGEALAEAMRSFDVESPLHRPGAERLGSRAEAVLDTADPNPVVCECETVTRAEVQDAIADGTGAETDLDEVRIRTRASMGHCQGGYCVHRLASELYPFNDLTRVREAYGELFQERWKGQRHALWGEQLSQAMENYALHATTMNRDDDLHERVQPPDFFAFDAGPEVGTDALEDLVGDGMPAEDWPDGLDRPEDLAIGDRAEEDADGGATEGGGGP